MSNELVKQNGKTLELTPEKIDLIRKTVAKDANNEELAMFLHMCKVYELDPFLKELVFIKRKVWNEYKRDYDEIPTMMLSRDGLLAIAHRSGSFDGMETNALYDDKENLTGAECTVWNKSFSHPIKAKVLFKEYCAKKKDGTPQALWGTKPTTMIQKVAEAQALRKAFNIKGVYIHEELESEMEGKAEIETITDRLAISEAVNASPENSEKFYQETCTKILDDLAKAETHGQLSHIKKIYEKEIGLFSDKDREYILSEFDQRFKEILTGEETGPEDTVIEADGSITGPKVPEFAVKEPVSATLTPKADPNALLAEREAFSKEYVPLSVKEIDNCATIAQLTMWKNVNAEKVKKCLPEYQDYVKSYLKTRFDKVKEAK